MAITKMEANYYTVVPSTNSHPQKTYILEWHDLKYSISSKTSTAEIIKGVTGYAKSGEILAIMGSSGSGKTSLLSIISGRIASQPNLKVSGTVSLNKSPVQEFKSTHYIKYVLQEDWLFTTQTVRESLQFAARLKVPYLTTEQINERVEEIIKDLKLSKVADNLIGNSMKKGLSGGEKKRVSIGCEIIANPAVLILDEPTSGLDSFTATHVVELLRNLANSGKIIVLTLHQPSSRIFGMLDRLILMSEGMFLYQGATKRVIKWFKRVGLPCPENVNPPDYFMRLLYVEDRKNMKVKEKETLELLRNHYSEHAKVKIEDDEVGLDLMDLDRKVATTTFFAQFRVIFARSLLNVKRQPMLSAVKIGHALFLGALVTLLYNRNGSDMKSLQNYQGVLFFNVITFISMAISAQSVTFPLDRPVFLKEYKEHLYGVCPFFLAKIISEIPFQVIFISLYTIIIYFVIPYNTYSASKFFIFWGVALEAQFCGHAIGYFVGSMTNNITFAVTVGPTIMMLLMIYGGFFSNTNSLAGAFFWLQYISPFNFTYRALILNQFTDFNFDQGDYNPIQRLSVEGELWENALAIIVIAFGYLIAASIVLKVSGEYYKKKA